MSKAGRYWHTMDDGRIQCDLCPRFCRLKEGQRGMCFVRKREDHQMVLTMTVVLVDFQQIQLNLEFVTE